MGQSKINTDNDKETVKPYLDVNSTEDDNLYLEMGQKELNAYVDMSSKYY